MRKNLLLVLALFTAICISVKADLTPAQQTEPEYMINNGYSEMTAEQAFIVKNRVAGEPCEPLYEKRSNKFVKFWKNIYYYLSPAMDTEERYHHDIKPSTHYTDL